MFASSTCHRQTKKTEFILLYKKSANLVICLLLQLFINRPKKVLAYLRIHRYDQQGRIHGQYQLRTGGQGRKCAFSHFSTRVHGPTNRPTNRRTDGRTDKASYRVACPQLKMLRTDRPTDQGVESRVRAKKRKWPPDGSSHSGL